MPGNNGMTGNDWLFDHWIVTVTTALSILRHRQNPSLADGCELIVGYSYCIEQNWGVPSPTSTISSSVASTSQTTTPTPTPTTTIGICEAEAYGYKRYCTRCLSRCANGTTYLAQCFNSVFGTINYYDSQCWQHGGNDCANKAVDIVCPQK
jgi:hypothetical protein